MEANLKPGTPEPRGSNASLDGSEAGSRAASESGEVAASKEAHKKGRFKVGPQFSPVISISVLVTHHFSHAPQSRMFLRLHCSEDHGSGAVEDHTHVLLVDYKICSRPAWCVLRHGSARRVCSMQVFVPCRYWSRPACRLLRHGFA